MKPETPVVANARETVAFGAENVGIHTLFATDFLAGVVVGVAPGQAVPEHHHEHKDEIFDVLAGEGEVLVGERWLPAGPGTMIYVPPGTRHALRNTGPAPWVLRETARERVYARTALRLVGRALLKRLGVLSLDRLREARSL